MPIFIAGCGRSGTSYLRTLLDAHPSVFIPSESLFIVDYLRNENHVPASIWRRMLAHEPQLLCWYTDPLPDGLDVAATLEAIHLSAARSCKASIWGQKTPRFVRHLGLLNRAFPDSRWIIVHRDPRAVAASMKQSGQHTSCIPLAVRRWRQDNSYIAACARGAVNDRSTMVIAYADLVKSRSAILSAAWLHVGVEPVQENAIDRNARPVFFSRSRFHNNAVRDGVAPDNAALERWRTELSPLEQKYIENECSAEMAALGYPPDFISRGPTNALGRAWLWLQVVRDLAIVVRYFLYWPEYPVRVFQRKMLFSAFRFWCKLRLCFRFRSRLN